MAAMEIRPSIAASLLAAALPAAANEGIDLALRSKAMAAASAQAVSTPSVVTRSRDPLPELLLRAENEQEALHAAGCAHSAATLCYDPRGGRVVYRGARAYMPHIDGLQPESVSLRRDGIVLRYSFR
jgi:hypothetical protein